MIVKRNLKIVKRNKVTIGIKAMIKRNKVVILTTPTKNLGGFLPDPPEYCERKDFWVYCVSKYWIDLSVCHPCPVIKECPRRDDYLNFLKKEREAKLAPASKITNKNKEKTDD